MIRNTLSLAIRHLLRNKIVSVINITGLSVGLTCCIVILIFVRYESSFDSFHDNAQNTYRVVQHTKFPERTQHWNTTAYPLAEALRTDHTDFLMVTQASGPVSRTFSVDDGTGSINRFEEKYVLFVDPWYPKVFNFTWLAGNPETALNNPDAAVLTKSLIRKCFRQEIADPHEVLGRTILLNGKDPLIITGVVDDAPGNTNLHYNILVAYSFFKKHNNYFATNWSGNYQGTTYVVLKTTSSKNKTEENISNWKKKYLKPEDDKKISYFLQPLEEIHNESLYGSSPGSYTMELNVLYAAVAIAAFILILASVNFINLTTAQAATRAKEVGVRKVIGGTRLKLITQFVGENTLLILITVALSIALSQSLLSQLNAFLTILNLKLVFQPFDVVIICAVGAAVIVLSALYPALVLSSFKPADALKNKALLTHSRGPSLRKFLIVLQFSVVQFFIIATIVTGSQMAFMQNKDLGFTKETVIMTPAPALDKLEIFRHEMLAENTITDVAFGANPPVTVNGIRYGTSFRLPGQSEEEGQECQMKVADLNYIDFFKLKLLAGRGFTSLKERFDEFLVNEKLIRAMGWTSEDAIGRKLVVNEGEGTIVGVLKDFHNNSLQEEIDPCVMYNWIYFQDWAFIKIQSRYGFSPPLASIEKVWKEFSPEGVYSYSFLDDVMAINYANEQMIFNGFTLFSVLAIFIGCLGLFGLMSFLAIRKTKEVGIRKVLGASVAQIVTLFSKEFAWLVSIAFCLASPLAYYVMEQWLNDFAYRIPISWWMFVVGGATSLLIALATISYQSIKSALANPVDSLRNE